MDNKSLFSRLFYDKSKIDKDKLIFSGSALWALLIPLIIEQILNQLMGVADTMMVSRVGGAEISAVANVDQINVLVIQVFSALATGAVIICSQYLGRNDRRSSIKTAEQVVLVVATISITITALCIIFCRPILSLIYGSVDKDVMDASITYFFITAFSFPFLALFSAGSAFFRAGGNAKFPMKISVISNIMNVVGNAVFIFIFNMGVMGAALSTLISRVFCMVVIFIYLRKPNQIIVIKEYIKIRPDFSKIGTILAIGIPSGIENGMFQFGKLAIQSSVATLSTDAQAAQAMAIVLEALSSMAAIGIGIGMMTVVGQAIGAGRVEEARYYIVKLTIWSEITVAAACIFIFALTPGILWLGDLNTEATKICIKLMFWITIFKPLVWTLAFIPSYGLRSAGDVKFMMISSAICMWLLRVALGVFLIRVMGFGPIAVWIAMISDWSVRAVIVFARFVSGRWANKKVIN